MRALVVLLLLTAGLAGCSDGGDGTEAGTGEPASGAHGAHGTHDAATHILAPTWEVGQWWKLESDQASAPFTHVVSGEAGDDWVLDTDSADIAFFDARFDISFLGKVRKSDLAGSQGAQRVEFFQFPLTQHKNWTTTWDGAPIKVHVASVEAGKAKLEARHGNGTPYADYTYDEKTGYFGEYAFYAADGVTIGFAAKVSSSGKAFSGDLVRWALETKYEHHGALAPTTQGFDVDAGFTDVWVDLHLTCTQGAFSLTFGPAAGAPEDRGYALSGPCPAQLDETSTITAPPQDNEAWGVVAAGPPQGIELDLSIIARTQTLFKPGATPSA